jgi:four helix bundle protein
MELETQLQIAENLGYLGREEMTQLMQSCAELGRMLNGLITSITRQCGA